MKPEEMMLGDWISFNGEPVKVQHIVSGINELDYDPIPITAEILEKNGFEVHRQFATFTEYWLDIPRKFVRVAPNSYIEIYNGENRNVHIDGKVYVHELQHALRLCGIDKEIVL